MLCDLAKNLFFLFIIGIVTVVVYIKWKYKHWENKGIPYAQPTIPVGTIQSILKTTKSFGGQITDQYNYARAKGYKHIGLFFFWRPAYLPVDPELVRAILAKDFNYFANRGAYYNEEVDPLSAHLFSIDHKKWKPLRTKLTPTFTSGKMKSMMDIVVNCGDQLKVASDKLIGKPVNIKDLLGRFTTNVIGTCAFGIDCNCFEDVDSEFIKYAKRVNSPTHPELIKNMISVTFPSLARLLKFKIVNPDVARFFTKVIKEMVEYRETNNVQRNDFMQILINLKNGKLINEGERSDGKENITLWELCSQAYVFFLAGYETSSSTMMFCLYELASNHEIQDRVREELNDVLSRHGNKITYESLGEMKYMGQVIDETLRKYPPLPLLFRECIADYKIANTNEVIEKGTLVYIPCDGLHNDPEYFENPDKFDPERFSDENKSKIVPFTYLPFGDGPRNCIGARFGLMQTKVGLSVLLKNYLFSVSTKTQLPLQMDPRSFVLSPLGDIWLDVQKL